MCPGAPAVVVQPPADAGPARTIAVAITLLCAALAVGSFVHTDWPRNDFERFDDLRLTVYYFVLLTAACLGYAKLCLDEVALSRRTVIAAALAASALLWTSFPVGSKDVFLYALFGKVWGTYHANPYQIPPATFPGDPWLEYARTLGAQRPAPYGPLFLWQAWAGNALARSHLWLAAWAHKAVATFALAAALLVAMRFLRVVRVQQPWHIMTLLALNPLLLFESAGNGHNDAVMLLLLVAGLFWHVRGGTHRSVLAPAILSLAVWYKWYAVLLMPAFVIDAYRVDGRQVVWRWIFSACVSAVVFGGFLMAPLADGTPVLLGRLIGHENLRTVFPLQLSPPLAALLWVCQTTGLVDQGGNLFWFDSIRSVVFAATILAALGCQWRGVLTLVQSVCVLALALAMFALSILWPWHLLVPVAFALLSAARPWILLALALTCLGLLSYFFTFAWAAAALIFVAAAVVSVRRLQPLPVPARRSGGG
jgi:hypothetical protein